MIKAEVTGQRKDNNAEVTCIIGGTIQDFMAEYEAIIRAIASNIELVAAADKVLDKLMKEKFADAPDCFRPKSDSIDDIINTILKEMKEND